jgi:hypothetical protein
LTSERKQRANRQNARASTGPRSAAGKARVAANARRHGLTIPLWFDQRYFAELEQLARRNLGRLRDPSPQLRAAARRLAQAQLECVRVCGARRRLFQPLIDSEAEYSPRQRKNMWRFGGAVIRKRSRQLFLTCGNPPTVEKLQLVLSDSAKELAGIERQEHRAFARLRRALQDFDAACILEAVSKTERVSRTRLQ